MRGYPLFNFPAFDVERDNLIALGYKVISPADLDREAGDVDEQNLVSPPLSYVMRRDIEALLKVQAIRFLPGWKRSEGAKAERFIGRLLDLTLWYPSMKVPPRV